MPDFTVGDIVQDKRRIDGEMYTYGVVVRIEDDKIYCWWSDYLENLKSGVYTCVRPLYTENVNLIIIKSKQSKKIKPYGISVFIDNLNKKG